MHELAITQSMFDTVIQYAEKEKAKRVHCINLVIGEMTGIVGDSVRFYMDFLSKNTIAEGATLNIKSIPTQAKCRDCKNIFKLDEFTWVCPDCGGTNLEITGGKELFIESIEID
jgi:hydrogenase nickel incorporation protein HypA/HybF